MQVTDDLSAQEPEIVHVPSDRLWGKARRGQMLDEWPEVRQQLFAGRKVFFESHPGARPIVQVAAIRGNIGGRHRRGGAVYSGGLRLRHHPRHGTDHDFKPLLSLLSSSGIRIRPRPFQSRQEVHRGNGA
jgi:hypothetical protein